MKKLLILAITVTVLLLSFSMAVAEWDWQYPSTSMVIPYFNSLPGFETYVMISHMDTSPDWGTDGDINVHWRFNPKCGRGPVTSATLTSHASFTKKPTDANVNGEGWVEIYEKTDVNTDDDYVNGDYALSGIGLVLDITNGLVYNIETVQYYYDICVDGSGDPLFYNCDCDASSCDTPYWGSDEDYPVTARLFRESDFGRSMFVLLDPSGRHIATDVIPDPAPNAGWDPANCTTVPTPASCKLVANKAQLDIFGKDETDAHLAANWCAGADTGKPGIVTIGVGSTTGPSGIVTDLMINNPSGLLGAPYGFGQAYQLRNYFWADDNGDGLMGGPAGAGPTTTEDIADLTNILGAVLTQVSPTYFPGATHAQNMASKWTED